MANKTIKTFLSVIFFANQSFCELINLHMRFTQKTGCFGQPSLFHGLIGSFVDHKVKLRVNKTKVNVRVNLFAVNLHIRWTKKVENLNLCFSKRLVVSADLQIYKFS